MQIQLNKAHFPVTVLGPGRRIGLWLQGCSIGCANCISQDTWAPDPQKAIEIDALVAWCRQVSGEQPPDGITISGGEPFEQPEALRALLEALIAWRSERGADFDLLVYSGLPLRRLQQQHGAILTLLDALIPEPYVDKLPLGGVWRGSANQPLLPLSARGRLRYADAVAQAAGDQPKRLQVSVDAQRIWYIGIPERGEMDGVEALCRERGLGFVKASWR